MFMGTPCITHGIHYPHTYDISNVDYRGATGSKNEIKSNFDITRLSHQSRKIKIFFFSIAPSGEEEKK